MQCAHIMAMAVQRLHKGAQVRALRCSCRLCSPPALPAWTEGGCTPAAAALLSGSRAPLRCCIRVRGRAPVQVTIGPWTERGFFYDFDMPQPLTERDLPKIRKEMRRILSKNLPFVREEVPAQEARRRIEASQSVLGRPPALRPACRVSAAGMQAGDLRGVPRCRQRASATSWRSSSPSWSGTPRPPSPSTTSVRCGALLL